MHNVKGTLERAARSNLLDLEIPAPFEACGSQRTLAGSSCRQRSHVAPTSVDSSKASARGLAPARLDPGMSCGKGRYKKHISAVGTDKQYGILTADSS